ncbi:hypothetical protein V5799_022304 [Amblyomma americanum]|uniref:Peptidase S1 domain-containing protein n=2 Tax=Amblyomma americanum TaxID=6943 RepID=A0AAQ4FL87_AMBAM
MGQKRRLKLTAALETKMTSLLATSLALLSQVDFTRAALVQNGEGNGALNISLNAEGCGEAMASKFVDVVAPENVVVAQNPWVVLLSIRMADTQATCSGTIVTGKHIVTNAQCLTREGATPRSVTVFYSTSEKYRGYRVRASHFLVHPDFSEATMSSDIALVMVSPASVSFVTHMLDNLEYLHGAKDSKPPQ